MGFQETQQLEGLIFGVCLKLDSLLLSWIQAHIKAAFGRVYKDYLLAKLHSIGVADTFIDFLNSYLELRIGRVAVEGVLSDVFELADMVFQDIVFGPSLWNIFFHDVANEASCLEGKEQLSADDLTVSKAYETILATIST